MRLTFWISLFAILYTIVGYPLMVATLARFFPRQWKRSSTFPFVSFIIAAFNEDEWIANKLRNTFSLSYPPEKLQVILAADGCSDRTLEIAATFPQQNLLTVFHPERQGKAAALNRAVSHSSGEVLVFTDANAMLNSECLERLVSNFADDSVGVVTGLKVVRGKHNLFGQAEALYWKYEAWIRRNETLVGQTTGVNGEILAVRRTNWRPLPPQTVNDDFAIALVAMSLGNRVIFEPQAIAVEGPAASATDELKRRQRMVAGRWMMLSSLRELLCPFRPLALWQVLSHKIGRALLPFFALVLLFANTWLLLTAENSSVLSTFMGMFQGILFVGSLFLILLVVLRFLRAPLPPLLGKFANLVLFVLVSQYGVILGFIRWLRGTQSPMWEKANRQSSPVASSIRVIESPTE
jgi:poly-beta-1,6-N-acetyl-D-glucosamine synthase